MAMGKRKRDAPAEFLISAEKLPPSPGHLFYERLNQILRSEAIDRFVEERCAEFYADRMGRPRFRFHFLVRYSATRTGRLSSRPSYLGVHRRCRPRTGSRGRREPSDARCTPPAPGRVSSPTKVVGTRRGDSSTGVRGPASTRFATGWSRCAVPWSKWRSTPKHDETSIGRLGKGVGEFVDEELRRFRYTV